METWRWVPGFEHWYEASDHGRFRSYRYSATNPRMLTPLVYRKGYLKICLSACGGTKKLTREFIHRLIWKTFRGPIPAGMTINHIDGVKSNNRIENLELATQSQQARHAFKLGLRRIENGERRSTAKITDAQAREIFERYWRDRPTQKSLAEAFGVTTGCVNQIVHRTRWRHATEGLSVLRPRQQNGGQ